MGHSRRFGELEATINSGQCFIAIPEDRSLPQTGSGTQYRTHQSEVMAQAIMDPDEVRRFAKELKRFNDELQVKSSSLNARFTSLGDTWKDQENQKFAEEFVGTMKALKKFIEISEKHTPYLLRKAQRIEEYLDQR